MAERIQQPLSPVTSEQEGQPDERVPAQPVPDLDKFRAMLSAIQNVDEKDKAEMAVAINEALIAMRAPGNDRAEAALILKELELKSFTGLNDRLNRSCHKEAVETLMVMGFPYALAISPEDFELAQRFVAATLPGAAKRERGIRRRKWIGATLGLLGNAALVAAAASNSHPDDRNFNILSSVFYVGTPLAAALFQLPRTRSQKGAMNVGMLMAFALMGGVWASLGIGAPALVGLAFLFGAAVSGYRLQNDFETWEDE